MAHEVFISYSSKDLQFVKDVTSWLENEGIQCFVAFRDIPKGIEWARIIPDAIKDSKMVVVLHSENYNCSEEVERELKIASDNKKRILTFKIDDSKFKDAKEYYLTAINWIDASTEQAMNDLILSIKGNLDDCNPESKKSPKKFASGFVLIAAAFILLFAAGFIHAKIRSSKPENLLRIALKNVKIGENPALLIYPFEDKLLVYDRVDNTIEAFVNDQKNRNELTGNGQPINFEAKIGYVGIGVLLSQAFKIKVGGRNQVFYYIGVALAIVGGYGVGYYVHETYYPVDNSSKMESYLNNTTNWLIISNELSRREQILKINK